MNEIRSMRQETIRSNPVLIAEGYGEARVSIDKSATTDRFIVALDGVDKAALKQKHADEFESMRLALSLEGKAPANFVQVADQVYFRHPSGRDVYSFSVSMNGRVYLSKSLSTEGVTDIQSRFLALQVDKSLSAVKRLSSRMTEHERDPLRAFLFGWSALEILIAKCFSRYEQQFMSPLADGPQTVLRGKFLFRVRDVMKDKYRLSDKFHCVSSILFAHSSEDDVRADVEQFQKIKKMRDTMLHGEEYDENGLPIEELASLLQKYTTAYLDAKP
ncbi:hypothetical protein ACQR1W_12440 [Bradyrhizobium sp. HKCCYLS1011]|uniref:hypothetical protein n=1 Tax=Bradyrhizobium sp. HKCCYLS1011 TaxID=3420733 RepID=UPI003EB7C16A